MLNIGPSPEGEWDTAAYNRLKEIGEWMKINGESIYGTRPMPPYAQDDLRFTEAKDHHSFYAICMSKTENTRDIQKIILKGISQGRLDKVTLLGAPGVLNYRVKDEGIEVLLPASLQKYYSRHAIVLKIIRAAANK